MTLTSCSLTVPGEQESGEREALPATRDLQRNLKKEGNAGSGSKKDLPLLCDLWRCGLVTRGNKENRAPVC